MNLACMLCGAAGTKELALAIAAVFGFMFFGSIVSLLAQILGGDFRDVATRSRPLEAEAEALAAEADQAARAAAAAREGSRV